MTPVPSWRSGGWTRAGAGQGVLLAWDLGAQGFCGGQSDRSVFPSARRGPGSA